MSLGRVSSAALLLSGVAGVVMPNSVGAALQLPASTPRGVTETRAGLGGTFTALGGWAFAVDSPAAQTAVGVTWLGAAVVRLGSLVVDHPRTDLAFWAYLAAEVGLGAGALRSARSAPQT